MIALPDALLYRWLDGDFTGNARPAMEVSVRSGYLQRGYRADGMWTAEWTPTTDWKLLPGVSRCLIEQSFDSNGIATATIDMANIAYREVLGPLGIFHMTERGWFSPFRAYEANARPGLGYSPNEWDGVLATAAQVQVRQGYGDLMVTTFTGLMDAVNAVAQPGNLTLTARDFGQLLTDCRVFGWNVDPPLANPLHFVGEDYVKTREAGTPAQQQDAHRMRNRWRVVKDLSGCVRSTLTWAGLQDYRVQNTGAPLKEPIAFGGTAYLIDIIRKAQDVTGYTFFMGEPTDAAPLGRPVFKRSNVATVPAPVAELRDDQLLTGLNWNRSDETLAGIIRVRGKPTPRARGGLPLYDDSTNRVMGVYRPPWHVQERDARLIRHVVHMEPLYETETQCLAAAQMIALQEALASVTATVEIPTHPGLQLDDIISIYDRPSGLATRAWIAQKQATFTAGRNASWKQSLGVSLLDTPDVVEVVQDLHETLVDMPYEAGQTGGVLAPG